MTDQIKAVETKEQDWAINKVLNFSSSIFDSKPTAEEIAEKKAFIEALNALPDTEW